jgi:hypothetical protein
MSAGREFTESPDPTQAFFCIRHKKMAFRSTIQRLEEKKNAGLRPAA